MKEISIPYGGETISLKVPDERLIFEGNMKYISGIGNFEDKLREKLDNPTECDALKNIIKPGDKILILIEDNTRNTPVKRILPVLIDYLQSHGTKLENIEILTAPGTHRIMTDNEIVEKVGQEIADKIKISQHDFQDESAIADLGYVEVGKSKIPVLINKKALEADFIIGLGNIIPHSDAGFSGGAKIMQPGICAYSTTAATHVSAALLDEIPLGFVENPCRLGMEEVAKKVGLKFIINVVMNNKGEVIALVAGDFVKAHREGAKISKEAYGVEIPEPADIVVVSSYPCDIDYWQALKGITSAYFAVKEGGYLVFAAPCHEGLEHNHPRLRDWSKLSLEAARDLAAGSSPNDKDIDLISADLAICNARIREKANILIVTEGLEKGDIEILGYTKFESVQEALDYAITKIPNGTIGILPRGGDCLPVVIGQRL